MMNRKDKLEKVLSILDQKLINDKQEYRSLGDKEYGIRSSQVITLVHFLIESGIINEDKLMLYQSEQIGMLNNNS